MLNWLLFMGKRFEKFPDFVLRPSAVVMTGEVDGDAKFPQLGIQLASLRGCGVRRPKSMGKW
jgi:hypothetical protein